MVVEAIELILLSTLPTDLLSEGRVSKFRVLGSQGPCRVLGCVALCFCQTVGPLLRYYLTASAQKANQPQRQTR